MAVAALKKERIGLNANEEQKSLLARAAGLKNISLSSYILSCSLRQAQIDLAECMEDKTDYDDAVAAWEEYEKSGRKSHSAEEVRRELGL